KLKLNGDSIDLPKFGLVPPATHEAFKNMGMYSWGQIYGNYPKSYVSKNKGITAASIIKLRESISAPISYSLELRDMGFEFLSKLGKLKVINLSQLLALGSRVYDLGNKVPIDKLFENLTRGNFAKGAKAVKVELSKSRKVKKADVQEFTKYGIVSIVELLISESAISDTHPLFAGYQDWKEIGELQLSALTQLGDKEYIHNGLKLQTLKEFLVLSDVAWRSMGLTNNQIKKIKTDFILVRSKTGQKKPIKKKLAKKSPSKSVSKKKPIKSKPPTKKAPTKKKRTKPKSMVKKAAKKTASKSTKKKKSKKTKKGKKK
ncbi:MAG: hypothetical protein IH840_00545, partial [Candidatus Heimdallarchaeota archaeon]|nr:hypothetical protein [Candidatus Heimdallarchaeota archaeon]